MSEVERQISVRMPGALVKHLESRAAAEDRPVASVIRRIVADDKRRFGVGEGLSDGA